MKSLVVEESWVGNRVRTFRDLIPPRPRALLIGLNPSPVSLRAGHYHQGSYGRRMWRRLEEAGILPRPEPGQFHDELLWALGLGITDIVKRPSPRSDELWEADYAYGWARLKRVVHRHRPPLLCFIYKKAAEKALGRRLPPGAGLVGRELWGARVFVLPGPRSAERGARRVLEALRDLLAGDAEQPGRRT